MESVSKGMKWHTDILPSATRRALHQLSKEQWLKDSKWYLAGGTALALQVGSRVSLDLDFFLPAKTFQIQRLLGRFSSENWVTDIAREMTVYGRLSGAKVSFIAYPFFRPQEIPHWYGSVRVLDTRDIATMKVVAISQRGRKRDFLDLYWYAKHCEPLEDVLRRLPRQYPNVAHNYHHILKSLMYFEDAEHDPMPEIFFQASWKEIKQFFTREVPQLTKRLIGLA